MSEIIEVETTTKKSPENRSEGRFRAAIKPIINEFINESNHAKLSGTVNKELDAFGEDIHIIYQKIEILKRVTEGRSGVTTASQLGTKLIKMLDGAILVAVKNKCSDEDGEDVVSAIRSEAASLRQEVAKLKKANSTSTNKSFTFR